MGDFKNINFTKNSFICIYFYIFFNYVVELLGNIRKIREQHATRGPGREY